MFLAVQGEKGGGGAVEVNNYKKKNGCVRNIETLSFSRGVFCPGEYFFLRVMVMCHWICSTFLCENASRKKKCS